MRNLSRLQLAGLLLGALAVTYLVLAITVIDYQPPGLGPILAGVMAAAGLLGLAVAWRTVRGAAGRRPPIAAAALLGGLPLVALASNLSQWFAQREGFERAKSDPGLGYAAPEPLLNLILVPSLIIAAAMIVIGAIITARPGAADS
jgi:hypothetical protein